MSFRVLGCVLGALFFAGCTTSPRSGEVVMVSSPVEALVAMPDAPIPVNQPVRIYRDIPDGGRNPPHRTVLLGEGTVIRYVAKTRAVVQTPAAAAVKRGDYVRAQ